jgi:opacity protein-like surface antigen
MRYNMKTLVNCQRVIVLFAAVAGFLVFVNAASAQVEMQSQVNLNYTGVFTKDSTGNGVTDSATRSGGLQVNYTYMFNHWAGAEGAYGWTRNTQDYSGDFGTSRVQANMHEITGAFVLRPTVHVAKVRPYVVAGAGALRFTPTSDPGNMAGALSQTKAAFLYGGGADFDVARHVGIRADYRGFLTRPPDFTLSSLTLGSTTHIAQPSIGIFFRF